MRLQTSRLEKGIIYIVSFFLYSGYYVGLSLLFATGRSELSRYYSIPLRLMLCVLMVYYISMNYTKIKKYKTIFLFFILFSLLYFLKILYTENLGWKMKSNWVEYIFYYTSYCFLPFLFYSFIDFKKYKKTILNALIFSGFLLGGLSLFVFKDVLQSGGIGRISLLTYETGEAVISPLALAYSGALTIILCLYKLIYENITKKVKTYLLVTIILSFILFFLGSTRGALLAVLLCLLSFLYFGNLRNKLRFTFLFILGIPLVIYGVEATGSGIFKRSQATLETGDSSGREPLWNAAIDEFISNPILGGRIEVSNIYPHNIFLEVLMATGIIGFILFMIFLLKSFKKGFNAAKINIIYTIPFFIFICAISQHMFTGALWSAIMLFAAVGMFNSKLVNK